MLATVCDDTVSFDVEQNSVTISDESFLPRLCDTSTYMLTWASVAELEEAHPETRYGVETKSPT